MKKEFKKLAKGGISLFLLLTLNGSAVANRYVNQHQNQQVQSVLEEQNQETKAGDNDGRGDQGLFNDQGGKIDLSRDERSYTGSEAETITKYLKKWEKEVKNYKGGGDWGIDDNTPSTSPYKKQFEEWKTLITSDKQGWFKNLEEYKELYPIYQFDQLVANYSWEKSVLKEPLEKLGITFKKITTGSEKGEIKVEGLGDQDHQIQVMHYIIGKFFPDFESNPNKYIAKILKNDKVTITKTEDQLFDQWKEYEQDNSQLLELFNYDQLKLDGSDEVNDWKTSDQYLSYFHQKDIPLAEQKALEQDRFKEWKAKNETLFKKVFKADIIKVKNLDSSKWITYKGESFLSSFKQSSSG